MDVLSEGRVVMFGEGDRCRHCYGVLLLVPEGDLRCEKCNRKVTLN